MSEGGEVFDLTHLNDFLRCPHVRIKLDHAAFGKKGNFDGLDARLAS
jgi:hypothetical protein